MGSRRRCAAVMKRISKTEAAPRFVYEAKSPLGSVSILVVKAGKPGDRYMASTMITRGSEGLVWVPGDQEGPFGSPEEACRCLSHWFDWFHDNGVDMSKVEFCENTLSALGLL